MNVEGVKVNSIQLASFNYYQGTGLWAVCAKIRLTTVQIKACKSIEAVGRRALTARGSSRASTG